MKKIYAIIIAIMLTVNVLAQQQNYAGMISQGENGEYFYMRSSLEMVYIDTENFPNKDIVDASWNDYMDPNKNFPNQYNKHGANIGTVPLGGNSEMSDQDMAKAILQYINRNHMANKLVMRWFDYNPKGSIEFDVENPENRDAMISMGTIFERGYYTVNAGDESVTMTALKRDRDTQIKDLSMKLIPFTFMTFTKFDFYENEPVARAIRDGAVALAYAAYEENLKAGADKTIARLKYDLLVGAADAVYNSTKDGYTLKSNTWLYKLVWDEKTEEYFNTQVMQDPTLLEFSDRFRMEYVDCQANQSTVIISLTRSFEEIIDLTMVRNLNKVFRDLQDRNDVFKVWTPLLDFYSLVSPNLSAPISVENGVITAKIGTKEGLRGGEQFALVDDYGTFYGYVVAQPGMVWDNDNDDIGADAQQCYEPQVDKKGNIVTSTTFKGKVPKNIYSGLLLTNPMPPKKHRIAARIGTKEGVEEGDSYAVYQYDAAADKLIKKGVVRVSKGHVWDNMFYNSRQGSAAASSEELKKRDKDGLRVTETVFTGSCNVQPGMFLRKAR